MTTASGTRRAPRRSVDAMLGGRFELVQPAGGHHRAGLEAVFLAAAVPAEARGLVVDLGAGAGAAGLGVAARCPAAAVLLAERQAELLACQRASLRRPANRDLRGRVTPLAVDLALPAARRAEAGLRPASAAIVVMNPPFHDAGLTRVSPRAGRAAAHVLAADGLDPWFRVAASVLAPGGELIVIFRADRLADLLQAAGSRFGGLRILPLHPRPGLPASRVLVAGRKGSRAASSLLPGLVLHGARGNGYLAGPEAILRHGAGLAEVHPPWAAVAAAPGGRVAKAKSVRKANG